MKVFNLFPTLGLDMLNYSFNSLINTDTKDSDFAFPLFVMFKHVLVVSHRCLARWAPRGPEIDQENLTLLVNDVDFLFGVDVNNSVNLDVLITSFKLGFDLNLCCLGVYSC